MTASSGTGASSVPVSCASSASCAYCAASALASSPALDQVLLLHEERCGSIAAPAASHGAQPQLERAHGAFSAPAAKPQDDRVQAPRSMPARLTASIRAFGWM